jgi:hypothetical protein
MRNPRDSNKGKRDKVPPLPPGGGAAARARQFALEHGLELDRQKSRSAPPSRRKSPVKKPKK